MARAEKATLRAADFLILESLSRTPMTTTELTKALQISRTAVVARIKRFQDMGLIIQRYPDRRWTVKLILRVETVAQTAEELGLDPPGAVEPQIKAIYPVSDRPENAILPPQQPREEVLRVVPDMAAPPPPEKPYEPRTPGADVSSRAIKLSRQFRMPSQLKHAGGELGMGGMSGCKSCGKGTPFNYGGNALCPLCSRQYGGK